jgi:geranylgeranyl pyrophosphate synthase
LLARRSRGHARDVRALLGTPMRTRAQFEALRGEMLKQGVAEETLAVARSYTRRADRELAGFPEGSARTDLSELANSLVNRTL